MLLAVRVWILLSTLLVGAGWILSAFHELNRGGYEAVAALAAAALFFGRGKITWPSRARWTRGFHKFRRRFQRPAPLLFLMLVSLSFVSGVLYAPHNSDTYAYRLPRVLHWLGREQWHWIHSADNRINVADCGYEWFVAPLLLFTRTDRFLFLINWIPFLMLPGLAFCVLECLGVRPRVAWWWAWLLSSGWCYVMQSASVANDAFAVDYALAAVALAMKSHQTGKTTDFWLSLLAAALLTGVKQTVLPLAMLWLLAAWPGRRITLAHPKTFFAMAASGLLVSAVPISVFNCLHTGTWTGLPAIQAEYPGWRIQLDSPFWGIVGNAFYVPVLNLLPPLFPWSGAWNHAMDVFVTTPFGAHFKSFERFGAVDSGISESSAGIGLAIVFVTAISIWAARKYKTGIRIKHSRLQTALRLSPWLLLVIFMAKVGETQNSRFLAGYYIFFFPSLLAGAGHEKLVRKCWWQKMTLLCMGFSIVLLVSNTSRPLFPAVTITEKLAAGHPHSRIISMLRDAYLTSRSLRNVERQIKEKIPANEPVVGYAALGNGQLEPALWLPFVSHRVERILKTDPPGSLLQQDIHYVVIENRPCLDCGSIEDWLMRYHASLISELSLQDKGRDSSQISVYVTRLNNK
jgi:hypothetical protein